MVSRFREEAIDSELASFVWGEKKLSQVKRNDDHMQEKPSAGMLS